MTRTIDAETLIKPTRFAHFVLRVKDLEKSLAWYETVLGMEIVHRADKIVFLTYDDEHHRMAIAETPVAAASQHAVWRGPEGAEAYLTVRRARQFATQTGSELALRQLREHRHCLFA